MKSTITAPETEINEDNQLTESGIDTNTDAQREEEMEIKVNPNIGYKLRGNTNPIMTQSFGADPFALVYEDTVYIYMTQDALEYDAKGEVVENTYGKINTIHCVSTKDMKNFTDHGCITVAGSEGHAKWAHNSWAPAAAVKKIDGKDKFFLYFADNGGGIGVLTADTPYGPFEDPLGHALISRKTPTCADVLWLFDPAVLVDDDGTGYIYFGGGVPEGKVSAPGTARVAKLTDDMIGIDGTPVPIDVPYLFEDSGIHKFNNKYYYTYCVNWQVDPEGTKKWGFTNAQIGCMVSDNPMGPFTFQETILENPGTLCGLYGNNHHAVFSFKDEWYITYHTRMLEKKMKLEKGYRVASIDKFEMREDGFIGKIKMTEKGPDQIVKVNPYVENSAVCVSQMMGTQAIPATEDISYGNMILGEINTDDYIVVDGVDFGDKGAKSVTVRCNVPENVKGHIVVRMDLLRGKDCAVIELTPGEMKEYTAKLNETVTGEHFLYLIFEGEGYTVSDWKFSE